MMYGLEGGFRDISLIGTNKKLKSSVKKNQTLPVGTFFALLGANCHKLVSEPCLLHDRYMPT